MKYWVEAAVIIMVPGLFIFLAWYFVTTPVSGQHSGHYVPVASEHRMRTIVKKLSDELPARSHDVDKLDVSARYIYKQFSNFTDDVEYQRYSVWGIDYQNIIGRIGGNDREKGIYVIGAHYDSYDGLPGADDNASGVAGIIELMALLSRHKPKYNIEFVAYALEEPPYFRSTEMGSYQHAKSLSDSGVDVRLMISLEMIGYFTEAEDSQDYPVPLLKLFYPATGNYIAVASNFSNSGDTKMIKRAMRIATPLSVYSINAPSLLPGIDFSDHLNYWYFSYPAVMITDTAFYRNKAYHTDNDTWDRLNYAKMAMVVDGVFAAVEEHMSSN